MITVLVHHCSCPYLQPQHPLCSPACNPGSPIIHFLFAQPCLLHSCSWEKRKSISQVPAPLCKSAFIELLESDMTRFSCIDGVAAQNAENSAGGGKAEGCAREESCSWLIFSKCCCCKMKSSFVCCWCCGGGATSQRFGPLTIFHSSGTIIRFFSPPEYQCCHSGPIVFMKLCTHLSVLQQEMVSRPQK